MKKLMVFAAVLVLALMGSAYRADATDYSDINLTGNLRVAGVATIIYDPPSYATITNVNAIRVTGVNENSIIADKLTIGWDVFGGRGHLNLAGSDARLLVNGVTMIDSGGTITNVARLRVTGDNGVTPSYFMGDVGIGTTTPNAELEVAGVVLADDFVVVIDNAEYGLVEVITALMQPGASGVAKFRKSN